MNRLFTAILFVVVLASSVVDAKKHEKAFRHGQKVQGSSSHQVNSHQVISPYQLIQTQVDVQQLAKS